jgi:hypothetical protein
LFNQELKGFVGLRKAPPPALGFSRWVKMSNSGENTAGEFPHLFFVKEI